MLSELGDTLLNLIARWTHAQSVDFGRRPQILGLEGPPQIRITPTSDIGNPKAEAEINVTRDIEFVDQDITRMNVIVNIPGVLVDDTALKQMN